MSKKKTTTTTRKSKAKVLIYKDSGVLVYVINDKDDVRQGLEVVAEKGRSVYSESTVLHQTGHSDLQRLFALHGAANSEAASAAVKKEFGLP